MNEWEYPYLNNTIGKRTVGRSCVKCPGCNTEFQNNLPWNAKYCPECGRFNGNRNNTTRIETKTERLQRQIAYLYHNAPKELQAKFDNSFPNNEIINGLKKGV